MSWTIGQIEKNISSDFICELKNYEWNGTPFRKRWDTSDRDVGQLHMQAYTDSILESIWTQNHIQCTHDAI